MLIEVQQALWNIHEFFLFILTNDTTGQVLLATSVGVLTIFIPIAISLFTNNSKEKNNIIDRAVILDHIIGGKKLIYIFSLLFLPILLWQGGSPIINIFILEIWALGLALSFTKLKYMYNWVRGIRIPIIFEYLREGTNQIDEPKVWEAIWSFSDLSRTEQSELVTIYVSKINHFFETNTLDSLRTMQPMLESLNVLLTSDNYYVVSIDGLFKEVLGWHKKSWEGEMNNLGDTNNIQFFGEFSNINNSLTVIFEKVMEDSLRGRHSYSFFRLFKEHANSNSENKININDNDRYYAEDILGTFYRKFFELIYKSKSRYVIWNHYFPKEWLVSPKSLDASVLARITFHNYIEWATERIRRASSLESKNDMALDSVSKEIFPNTNPLFWSIVLTYVLQSWGEEGRVKSLVETKRVFGFSGRITSWSGSVDERPDISKLIQDNEKMQFNYTVELMDRIFPNILSGEVIDAYIKELEGMSYDDAGTENSRKELVGYFKRIEKYRRNDIETVSD